jgi:hypothetical protein
MKTIIAGSRSFADGSGLVRSYVYLMIFDTIEANLDRITEVVSGCARGPDRWASDAAFKIDIPVRLMPAEWSKHGKAAGPIRNRAMAKYADALIMFWDGKSRGSRNMIEQAMREGLRVHVEVISESDKRDLGAIRID